MLAALDETVILTRNQKRVIVAATVSTALEYFDYFIIGFIMAFIVTPWKLTFGETAVVLLSSGVGATIGAFFWGHLADRVGRRRVLIATVLVFSLATGALALTPEGNWLYLACFRMLVGFGVGGLYSVQLPLVQEFMPAARRGQMAGLVTSFVSVGIVAGELSGAFLTPLIGWRGLFALGLLPALFSIVFLLWVPESPFWLAGQGREDEARRSLGWALQRDPASFANLPDHPPVAEPRFGEIFRYPRALLASWLSQIGYQAGANGVALWAPTLLVALLAVEPAEASRLMIGVSLMGMLGRLLFSYASEYFGRRTLGVVAGCGSAAVLMLAAVLHSQAIAGVSLFWLFLMFWGLFGDGGYAVTGPYSAEVWPSRIRTTGMGSAYGFGGLGKIIGPLALALVIGSSDVISPKASIGAITPAFGFYAACYLLSAVAFLIGFETKGLSLADVDRRHSMAGDAII